MEEEKGKSATPGSTRELPKLPKEVWAHIGSFLAKDGYLYPFSLTCAEFRDVAWELTVRRGDKGAGQVCQEGGSSDEDRRRKNRRVGGEGTAGPGPSTTCLKPSKRKQEDKRTLGTTLRDPVKVDRTQCPFVLRKERATPTKAYLKWAFKSTSE